MLNKDQELSEKISDFLRRKEVQYPELVQTTKRERTPREFFKSELSHGLRFAFGSRH